MRTGRPKAVLTLSTDERAHLLAITRSRSLPAALSLRAKIVLACEREPSNAVVATRIAARRTSESSPAGGSAESPSQMSVTSVPFAQIGPSSRR